jgi:hypothetical protein
MPINLLGESLFAAAMMFSQAKRKNQARCKKYIDANSAYRLLPKDHPFPEYDQNQRQTTLPRKRTVVLHPKDLRSISSLLSGESGLFLGIKINLTSQLEVRSIQNLSFERQDQGPCWLACSLLLPLHHLS